LTYNLSFVIVLVYRVMAVTYREIHLALHIMNELRMV
jgi:hypothetical protein